MPLIQNILIAGSNTTLPAEIYLCNFADVIQWQRQIHQPFIAPLKKIGSDWHWPALFIGCQFIEQIAKRRAIAFQLRVPNSSGDAVPIAQAIVSLPYFWPHDVSERCVFLWFVSSSPRKALDSFGVNQSFVCLDFVIDTAVQISLDNGLQGRVGLHAASSRNRADSDALMKRYLALGLDLRKKRAHFFSFPTRKDDGRLFYFTETSARQFSSKWDHLR